VICDEDHGSCLAGGSGAGAFRAGGELCCGEFGARIGVQPAKGAQVLPEATKEAEKEYEEGAEEGDERLEKTSYCGQLSIRRLRFFA